MRDEDGNPQVETTGLLVELVLSNGASEVTFTCAAPDANTGAGDCEVSASALAVIDGWFSAADAAVTAQVQVTYGSGATSAGDAVPLTLAAVPTYTALASAGMYLALPTGPLIAGTTFKTTLYANTDGYALGLWTVQMMYDPAVLTVTSFAVNANYHAPVTSTGTGVMSVFVPAVASGVTSAAVTGSALALGEVTLAVTSPVASGTYGSAFTALISQMGAVDGTLFQQQVYAQINDAQGGAQTAGQLVVKSAPAVVGMYAYAAGGATLLNTAYLNGINVSLPPLPPLPPAREHRPTRLARTNAGRGGPRARAVPPPKRGAAMFFPGEGARAGCTSPTRRRLRRRLIKRP
eukprot:9492575-Pyramimonas_sp.AAC.1